jgi:hypothetical protein
MARFQHRQPVDPAHLAHLADLVAASDPARVQSPGAPGARFRRKPVRVAALPHGPRPAPPPAPRVYVHEGPTGSVVLNAFLREVGEHGLVQATVTIPNARELAPKLVECARRWWPRMLSFQGVHELAAAIERETGPITNEAAARFLMHRAVAEADDLGAIVRDYEEHRSRAGHPERDDRLAACMMAAFAGRMLHVAAEVVGSHVGDELRRELRRLTIEAPVPRSSF